MHSRRRHGVLAALGLFAITAGASIAGAASITGRVVERGTDRPIAEVAVRLGADGPTARTDRAGHFTFADVPPGVHVLTTRHVAWASLERTVIVPSADTLRLALSMAVYRTDEVVVRSTRATETVHASPMAAHVVSREELRSVGGLTPAEPLGTAPGLALVRDGSWQTALSIRGQCRGSIVTLIDDTRVETAQDLAGALSLVDLHELERAEVVLSPGSVLFGTGALGGAVHLMTRRPRFGPDAGWTGEWSSGVHTGEFGLSHHAALEHAGPAHALRLSAGRRRAGDTRTPAGDVPNSSFGEWSTATGLGLRGPGGSRAFVSYQRVQAEDAGIPGGGPIAATAVATYRVARRERFALELQLPPPSRTVALLTARVAHQSIAREVEIVQSPTVLVTPHATHDATSAQIEARLTPGRRHGLIVGIEAWRRDLDSRRERLLRATNRRIGERPVPRSSHTSGGVYAQHEWELRPERTRVVLGARADANRMRNERAMQPEWVEVGGVPQVPVPGQFELWSAGRSDDASWDASAGVHHRWNDVWSASVHAATAYRTASLEERFQYLDLGSTLRVGDPDLRSERSRALGGGVRLETAATTVQVDGFVHALTDLVSELPGTFQGRAAFVKTNVGRAQLHGFETSVEQRLGRAFAARGALAFVRGLDYSRGANLSQVSPLSGTFELRALHPRVGTLRAGAVAAATQRHPGPGEPATPGWVTWNASGTSGPLALAGSRVRLRAGVDNVFDRAYRRHLSTLRGAIPLEPGRRWTLSATFEFGRVEP